MVSRVIAVAVDCHDAERLCTFWAAALGRTQVRRWRDARGCEYVQLDGDPALLFQPVPEGRAGKNRLHLDIAPAVDVAQAAEVARLVEHGAVVVSDDPELPWVVLTDPEGNEFCVLPER